MKGKSAMRYWAIFFFLLYHHLTSSFPLWKGSTHSYKNKWKNYSIVVHLFYQERLECVVSLFHNLLLNRFCRFSVFVFIFIFASCFLVLVLQFIDAQIHTNKQTRTRTHKYIHTIYTNLRTHIHFFFSSLILFFFFHFHTMNIEHYLSKNSKIGKS